VIDAAHTIHPMLPGPQGRRKVGEQSVAKS
jgi:hypothetical protein